jgi:hypothetical protein
MTPTGHLHLLPHNYIVIVLYFTPLDQEQNLNNFEFLDDNERWEWNGCGNAHCLSIFLERLRKTTRHLDQDSMSMGLEQEIEGQKN